MLFIIQEKVQPKKLYQDQGKDHKNFNTNATDPIANGSSLHNKTKPMQIFLKLSRNSKVKQTLSFLLLSLKSYQKLQ